MELKDFLIQNEVDAFLTHSDSICSADMYYATGFLAGDAFTYLNTGKEILLVSGMEKSRAEKESRVKDIRSTSDYKLKEKLIEYQEGGKAYCMMLAGLIKEEGCNSIAVPRNFPLFYAQCLSSEAIHLNCIRSPITKLREKKTSDEIHAISTAQRACEQAVAEALDVIGKARIQDDELIKDGKPLTAEDIRAIIHHYLIDNGCEADHTIVACGPGSADPHWRGSGVLKANQPIVLDVFPRHTFHRYYCDMSRTVVRGEPGRKIQEMHEAVLAVQEMAINMIRPGIMGNEVHQVVCDSFNDAGFDAGDEEGFIHSTGHSVGLDIHEKPGLGLQEDIMEEGNVVTVEPGLYYKDVGGVRIEDMVLVTASGCKNLTIFDKNLQV
ncbi:MAG: aminopeptidase P family protein [Methanosarcinales archaeon]|nr:aminopeptidase P family protein [Methanosarcinales archaeon]